MIKQSYPALTGFRAIAAYLVFFYHNRLPSEQAGPLFDGLQKIGNVGVALFFVLSGFLITHRYYGTSSFTLKWYGRFLQNRFARIYPVYFLVVAIAFFLHRVEDFGAYFVHLTLTVGFADPSMVRLPQIWSLTVEECFYMTAPVLFWFQARKKIHIAFTVLVGCGLALWYVGTSMDGLTAWYPFNNFHLLWTQSYFGRFFEFFCGMIAALWSRENAGLKRYDSILGGQHKTWLGLSGVIICFYGIFWFCADHDLYTAKDNIGRVIHYYVLPIFIALLIWGLAKEETFLQKILGSRVMDLLGKSSYTFYLIHMGAIMGYLSTRKGLSVPWAFVAINLVSIFIFKIYEEPMQKLLRSKK